MYVCNQGRGDEGNLALSRGCALWRAFFPSTDRETALFGTKLIDETNESMPVLLVQRRVAAHRYTKIEMVSAVWSFRYRIFYRGKDSHYLKPFLIFHPIVSANLNLSVSPLQN